MNLALESTFGSLVTSTLAFVPQQVLHHSGLWFRTLCCCVDCCVD
jgi:hypothetical protein